jgi:hypothetical protein
MIPLLVSASERLKRSSVIAERQSRKLDSTPPPAGSVQQRQMRLRTAAAPIEQGRPELNPIASKTPSPRLAPAAIRASQLPVGCGTTVQVDKLIFDLTTGANRSLRKHSFHRW